MVLAQVLLTEPPPPSQLHPDIDPALQAICLKAMAKKPEDRYASMSVFAAVRSQPSWRTACSRDGPVEVASPLLDAEGDAGDDEPRRRGDPSGRSLREAGPGVGSGWHPATAPIVGASAPGNRRGGRVSAIASVAALVLFGVVVLVAPGQGRRQAEVNAPKAVPIPDREPRPQPDSASEGSGNQPSSRPVAAPTAPDSEGWVSLFNGSDLAGWKTHPTQPAAWKLRDGYLTGPDSKSYLYSERGDYRDFHLRLEVRIAEGGNSGVYIRAPFGPVMPEANKMWPDGYEATISTPPLHTGALLRATKAGDEVLQDQPPYDTPPDRWFILEIFVDGHHIIIKVNGTKTADYVHSQMTAITGHLVLQAANPAVRSSSERSRSRSWTPRPLGRPLDRWTSRGVPVGSPAGTPQRRRASLTARRDEPKIREAIKGGVRYLVGRQNPDGSWPDAVANCPTGTTSLVCWPCSRPASPPIHHRSRGPLPSSTNIPPKSWVEPTRWHCRRWPSPPPTQTGSSSRWPATSPGWSRPRSNGATVCLGLDPGPTRLPRSAGRQLEYP